MNKTTKFIYYLHNLLIGLLLLAMLGGAIFWAVESFRAKKEWQQVQAAILLVKAKINGEQSDVFSGCVYPDNGVVIVSVNREDFFGVKDEQVFMTDITAYNKEKLKKYGENLPVESYDIDAYYLFEYCR